MVLVVPKHSCLWIEQVLRVHEGESIGRGSSTTNKYDLAVHTKQFSS